MLSRAALASVLALHLVACSSGYAGLTSDLYEAVEARDPQRALAEADRLVAEVLAEDGDDLVDSAFPLLLLERAAVRQALGDHEGAAADLAEADQLLELLDLTPEGTEELTRFLFSDDTVLYRAPIYEKLLLNMSAIGSYLALGDFGGAKVEARRLTVLLNFFEGGPLANHAVIGTAHYIAGLAMELGGDPQSALRHYIDASAYGTLPDLNRAIARLAPNTSLSERGEVLAAREALGLGADDPAPAAADQEVVVIVFSGLAPRREAVRYPIGLVFGWITAGVRYSIVGYDHAAMSRIVAEQALTWVNFPELVSVPHSFNSFEVALDSADGGQPRGMDRLADFESFALAQWEADRPAIAASALTRTVTRVLAREATQAATGNGTAGFLAGLAVQGALQAADTPDTRSWRTMPAYLYLARLAAPVGESSVRVTARGRGGQLSARRTVTLEPGRRAVVVVRFFE